MQTLLLFFLISSSSAAAEPPPQCVLDAKEVLGALTRKDYTDPANPAYRRPKAEPFCRQAFALCPASAVQSRQVMGEQKFVYFTLTSPHSAPRYFVCRFTRPAPINRGGADEPYYSYSQRSRPPK